MKSLILVISLVTAAILLQSGCEKHKDCYECTRISYSVYETKFTLCDVTEEEVEMFEIANSGSSWETKCVKE